MNQLSFWKSDGRQARWAPLQLEPVVGTGEKITVAIALDLGEGIRIHPLLSKKFLEEAFGESASDFKSLMDLIVSSLEKTAFDETSIQSWEAPFEGVSVGEFASVVGPTVQDMIDSASMLASSFYRPRGPRTKVNRKSDHKSRLLESEIRDSVVRLHPSSKDFFSRSIPGLTSMERRIGFFDDFYAAQFGVLIGGSSIGTCKAFTQAKLWDLERLRDTPRLFEDTLSLEFIAKETPRTSSKDSSVIELREMLSEEAAKAEISFVTVTSPGQAADQLLSKSVLSA